MPKPEKIDSDIEKLDEEDIDTIDLDFFELFEVLEPKEIVQLLQAVGGKFTISEGNAIKKLVEFLNSLDDDQLDNLIDAFDKILNGWTVKTNMLKQHFGIFQRFLATVVYPLNKCDRIF